MHCSRPLCFTYVLLWVDTFLKNQPLCQMPSKCMSLKLVMATSLLTEVPAVSPEFCSPRTLSGLS